MLLDRLRLTLLRLSRKVDGRNVLMISIQTEHFATINALDISRAVPEKSNFLFLFCFQFSTPCTSMTTSKSGLKILIAPFLAVWRCFSLSTICKEKFAKWSVKTSLEPSWKLESLK